MVIGFNNDFPILATAYNSEEDKYPIVHAVFSYEDKGEDKREYFIRFEYLADIEKDADNINLFKSELMKMIIDESNISLPYKIDDNYYRFTNNFTLPNKKYALIPLI